MISAKNVGLIIHTDVCLQVIEIVHVGVYGAPFSNKEYVLSA